MSEPTTEVVDQPRTRVRGSSSNATSAGIRTTNHGFFGKLLRPAPVVRVSPRGVSKGSGQPGKRETRPVLEEQAMKRLAIATVLGAAAAQAQSFNVDINASSGAGAGIPITTFEGAAGQEGNWNGVGAQTSFTLVGLNGVQSAVTLTRTGGGSIVNNSTGALGGDDEKLLEDAFVGSGPVTYAFNNL